ncbi:acyl carrier protein [Actinocrispum wychmicini]|uniref:Act minimal PKS acyl carrier protein n=1 Tax=Actinocrispum wychmicini TaxID=1213861 RepID=A0A4R2JSW1_9PSEU|nr:acyl carrier protein [Actinocrispum wychmicini]TCO62032.1 act minimal PKS acyl carrier protein [Actinocrispum wychmicini]
MAKVRLADLMRIMRECAGEDEGVELTEMVAETPFTDLGYDSLALMETTNRLERDYDIRLPEEDLADITTPAQFVAYVNGRLAQGV